MKILALEFSAEERSVAIVENGCCLGRTSLVAGRATPAFALIETVLAQARIEREEVGCIAIGLGPGSYTGIRTAISLAQGWQLGLGTKLLGIPSTDCLAKGACLAGIHGMVNVVIDAQRNEVYLARYEITKDGYTLKEPLKIIAPAEVAALADNGEKIIGPESTKWFPNATVTSPQAEVLGILAGETNKFAAGETIEPIYLRETSFVKAPPPRILPT